MPKEVLRSSIDIDGNESVHEEVLAITRGLALMNSRCLQAIVPTTNAGQFIFNTDGFNQSNHYSSVAAIPASNEPLRMADMRCPKSTLFYAGG